MHKFSGILCTNLSREVAQHNTHFYYSTKILYKRLCVILNTQSRADLVVLGDPGFTSSDASERWISPDFSLADSDSSDA